MHTRRGGESEVAVSIVAGEGACWNTA